MEHIKKKKSLHLKDGPRRDSWVRILRRGGHKESTQEGVIKVTVAVVCLEKVWFMLFQLPTWF